MWPLFSFPFTVHFISIKPVLSDHLPYVTPFHCSLVRSHKAGLTFIKNMTEMYSMCEPTRMTNLSYYIVYMYVIWTQFHIVPGPSICAWISVMSSSFGNILIPSGGSLHKSAISLATPLITCGDKFSTFETYSNRDYKWTLLTNQKKNISY